MENGDRPQKAERAPLGEVGCECEIDAQKPRAPKCIVAGKERHMIPDQKSMVKILHMISGKPQWTDPKDEESRKDLRPGEILLDDYFRAFCGGLHDPLEWISIYDLAEWTFLQEIAIIFDWGPFTRPSGRKIHKEWWYIKGRKRSNSRWRLSGFDRRFVQKMMNNLARCGIFTIEDDIWTFKGFPEGWERKWRKVHLPT
jgi:hypothetical protein